MVLDASLLNTQHYKVRIKGKVEQSREGVAPSPTPWCSSYRKGSLRVTLDYGRQLYLLIYIYIYIYIYIRIHICVCVCVWDSVQWREQKWLNNTYRFIINHKNLYTHKQIYDDYFHTYIRKYIRTYMWIATYLSTPILTNSQTYSHVYIYVTIYIYIYIYTETQTEICLYF